MYFAIVLGKRFERLAIQGIASSPESEKWQYMPIIRPPEKERSSFTTFLKELPLFNRPFSVAINSTASGGDMLKDLIPLFPNKFSMPTYEISRNSTVDELTRLRRLTGKKGYILHLLEEFPGVELFKDIIKEAEYTLTCKKTNSVVKEYSPQLVLVEDCFHRQARNADYEPEELLTESTQNLKQLGFVGFADFQMIGQGHYGGGPAFAVAIHWTYAAANRSVRIRHFVSEHRDGTENVHLKYREALDLLVAYLHNNPDQANTLGAKDYFSLASDPEFHGLGYLKAYSAKHHIEVLSELLKSQ